MLLAFVAALLVRGRTPAVAGVGALSWHPCEEDSIADCATLTLPVDRADPATLPIRPPLGSARISHRD
ncbi:hypothetical protein [Kutzneria sp. CA-103260]|uniref:hypothetical protein n=1 Tax=Kutzneria sp. CA-103260 TaxID=2802641 RepID=UPI001BA8C9EF|nr:hypothetical protein [Kutzneria sp. CA-103260]